MANQGAKEPDLEVASGESEDIDVLRRRLARAARRARAVRTAVCIIQAMLTHRSPETFIAAVRDYLQDHSRSEVEITAAEVSYLRRSRHCRLPDSWNTVSLCYDISPIWCHQLRSRLKQ